MSYFKSIIIIINKKNIFFNNICGVLFSSRPRDLVLVAVGFFAIPYKKKLPPPLPYKRELKRKEYHQ